MKLAGFQDWMLANPAFMQKQWPEVRNFTSKEALEEMQKGLGAAVFERIQLAREVDETPTVAITGLINSGKSSLLGLFLSQNGRERLLRGFGQNRGTHRFTLWFPSHWAEDQGFLEKLREKMAHLFGHDPEMLDHRPSVAHDQQRDASRLGIPLLAADGGLNRMCFSLLDCPDVQRKTSSEKEGENLRLAMLEKASEFCSGIIFVTTRRDLEVRQVDEILHRVPEANRFYAINLCRPEDEPMVVREEAEKVFRLREGDGIYIAYDYMIEENRGRIPRWDSFRNMPTWEKAERALPCFFSVSEDLAENVASRVGQDRSLLAVASRIDPEVMRLKRHQEHLRLLEKEWNAAIRDILSWLDKQKRQTNTAVGELVGEFSSLFESDGEVRIIATRRLVAEMNESFMRTAPWLVRPFWKLRVLTEKKIRDWLTAGVRDLFPNSRKSAEAVNQRSENLRAQTVPSEKVARSLEDWAEKRGVLLDHEKAKELAVAVIKEFYLQEESPMTPSEWDEITREIWKKVPRWKAVGMGAAVSLGLGALFLVPLDGGVVSLTAGQLLSVLGLGGIASAEVLRSQLSHSVGLQQKDQFLAALGKVLQLPPESEEWPWKNSENSSRTPVSWTFGASEDLPWKFSWYSLSPAVLKKVYPLSLE
ncbi:MAG: hypothetical protein LAT55_00575 [Opitutales bacterium]|nr:hypothetical protein [Opitutales bacterium]